MDFSDLDKHIASFNDFLSKSKMKKVTHADPRGVSHSSEEPAEDTGVNIGKALATYNSMCQKAAMNMSQNPDKDADAELGENVEHLVEDHFEANPEAEAKEGHSLSTKKKA